MAAKSQYERFVERALSFGPAYLLAPELPTDPLTNLGTLALSPAELKSGAALSASGLVDGGAAAVLDGTNDYIDTLWETVTNEITDPYFAGSKWSAFDANWKVEYSAEKAKYGNKGLKLTSEASQATAYAKSGITVPKGTTKTISVIAWLPAAGNYKIRVAGVGMVAKEEASFTARAGGGWETLGPFTYNVEGPGAGPFDLLVQISRSTNFAKGDVVWFGAVINQPGTIPTQKFHPTPNQLEAWTPSNLEGGLAGFAGTPHASVSDIGPFARGTARTFVAPANRATSTSFDELFGDAAATRFMLAEGNQNATFQNATWASAWPGNAQTVFAALKASDAAQTAELFIGESSQGEKTSVTKWAPGGHLSIGNSAGNYFGGSALPFAVFLRTLTPAEIKSLYRASAYIARPPRITQERPSDRIMVRAQPLDGEPARWAEDESHLENVISGLRLIDENPGGEKELQGVLPRDPRADWRDTELYGEVVAKSITGEVVWGPGQLDKASETDGDKLEVAPVAVGYRTVLDDNKATKLGIIDASLERWGEIPTELRKLWEGSGIDPDAFSPSSSPAAGGTEADEPAGITFTSSALKTGITELGARVYDSGGPEYSKILYDFHGRSVSPDADFLNLIHLSRDGINVAVAGTDHNATTALQQTMESALAALRYAIMASGYAGVSPSDPHVETFGFHNVKVLGTHEMVPRGTWPEIGYTAEQILSYAIPLLAPPLELGEMEDDEFVIPHAWFADPTTMGAIVNEVTKYGLLNWYVQGKKFNLRFPGEGARKWQIYEGLRETGKDGQRLWESIVVQWQDVDGTTKTAGPPGSGATFESEGLRITDPEHPAVKSPRVRRDLLVFKSVGVASEAIKAGERWLDEANLLDRSGDCTLHNYVMDEAGNEYPVSYVRGWDLARFPLKADKSYRRITRREYTHDDGAVNLSIDAPPEGMDALLERYNAALIPYGL